MANPAGACRARNDRTATDDCPSARPSEPRKSPGSRDSGLRRAVMRSCADGARVIVHNNFRRQAGGRCPLDAARGAAGFIFRGDFVDVVFSAPRPSADGRSPWPIPQRVKRLAMDWVAGDRRETADPPPAEVSLPAPAHRDDAAGHGGRIDEARDARFAARGSLTEGNGSAKQGRETSNHTARRSRAPAELDQRRQEVGGAKCRSASRRRSRAGANASPSL